MTHKSCEGPHGEKRSLRFCLCSRVHSCSTAKSFELNCVTQLNLLEQLTDFSHFWVIVLFLVVLEKGRSEPDTLPSFSDSVCQIEQILVKPSKLEALTDTDNY